MAAAERRALAAAVRRRVCRATASHGRRLRPRARQPRLLRAAPAEPRRLFVAPHHERAGAEIDFVAGRQHDGAVDPLAVDERAVGRPKVVDDQVLAVGARLEGAWLRESPGSAPMLLRPCSARPSVAARRPRAAPWREVPALLLTKAPPSWWATYSGGPARDRPAKRRGRRARTAPRRPPNVSRPAVAHAFRGRPGQASPRGWSWRGAGLRGVNMAHVRARGQRPRVKHQERVAVAVVDQAVLHADRDQRAVTLRQPMRLPLELCIQLAADEVDELPASRGGSAR